MSGVIIQCRQNKNKVYKRQYRSGFNNKQDRLRGLWHILRREETEEIYKMFKVKTERKAVGCDMSNKSYEEDTDVNDEDAGDQYKWRKAKEKMNNSWEQLLK